MLFRSLGEGHVELLGRLGGGVDRAQPPPPPEDAVLGRGDRDEDLLVGIEEAGIPLLLQDADDLEGNPPDLDRLAEELEAWGSSRTVTTYFRRLREIAELAPGDLALLAEVAEGLFKLTAYKDEYEVARLMTDVTAVAEAAELAGGEGRIQWRLHPPALRALGMERKISIGEWAAPAIRMLARGKRLRGTPADPFRWAEVRRVERQLPGEYLDALRSVLSGASDDRLERAQEIAALPEVIRGYEHIKLANVERFRQGLSRLA